MAAYHKDNKKSVVFHGISEIPREWSQGLSDVPVSKVKALLEIMNHSSDHSKSTAVHYLLN